MLATRKLMRWLWNPLKRFQMQIVTRGSMDAYRDEYGFICDHDSHRFKTKGDSMWKSGWTYFSYVTLYNGKYRSYQDVKLNYCKNPYNDWNYFAYSVILRCFKDKYMLVHPKIDKPWLKNHQEFTRDQLYGLFIFIAALYKSKESGDRTNAIVLMEKLKPYFERGSVGVNHEGELNNGNRALYYYMAKHMGICGVEKYSKWWIPAILHGYKSVWKYLSPVHKAVKDIYPDLEDPTKLARPYTIWNSVAAATILQMFEKNSKFVNKYIRTAFMEFKDWSPAYEMVATGKYKMKEVDAYSTYYRKFPDIISQRGIGKKNINEGDCLCLDWPILKALATIWCSG
jgi:hypothetical protein